MPLLKFHMQKGRSHAEIELLLDVAHKAMLSAFNVPVRDRYQLVFEHEPTHLRALDTGLGFERSQKFVLVEVVSRPRQRAEKLAFYQGLAMELEKCCGVPSSDVMVSFVENSDEDWSFGEGTAQFVTGQL
ncbi:tautomerase family protein [Agrobacterium sp. NPDC090283]|uniref:tautomerase family protein n=1 Tax=Agrobacterium sp. NPDC090283 TaxID=3363920 RepID=UPI00383B2C08